ncbi:MAG: hypothetical protein VX156_06955, partial [Pseudomonadota bacterium]|nr:hypothetical protein [Pseudomonadota bacterium]
QKHAKKARNSERYAVVAYTLHYSVLSELDIVNCLLFSASQEAVTEEELKQFTLDHGPAYAHPRKIIIINEMPLNGAGKIDRSEALAIIKNSIGVGGTL